MQPRISRRAFATGVLASVITPRKGFTAGSEEQNLTIHARSEIGMISPYLHGSFAEHLGSCVYGGLWVGPKSSIPNTEGYRTQAIQYLKELGIPVLRWPGGCFADDYHWKDGIGPVEKRRKITNIHWGNYIEDNSFGTHEFLRLCKLIGAEPYLAGNVGSGTPDELRDWVEYCNYPSGTTMSDLRAANGSPEPFRVKFWGVGNENWGCGGNMSAEEYAANFKRFQTYVRTFGDTRPFTIACGPNRNDTDWTRRFMTTVGPTQSRFRGVFPSGYAMHFYSNGRDVPTKFTVENMQQQLSSFAQLEEGIRVQRGLLDSYLQLPPNAQLPPGVTPQRQQVQLIVDEWGVWDRMIPEEEKQFGRLWMQSTMRSAVAAAMGLDVFHRQADKLYMCNIAQTVNVLQSVLLAHENNCIRTSSYYAFALQKPHRDKMAIRVDNATKPSPLNVSASASRKDNEIILTLINPKHDTTMKVNCGVVGASASSVTAQILHHPDYNACNTFEQPNVIVPKNHTIAVQGGRLSAELPPMSIVSASIRIAS